MSEASKFDEISSEEWNREFRKAQTKAGFDVNYGIGTYSEYREVVKHLDNKYVMHIIDTQDEEDERGGRWYPEIVKAAKAEFLQREVEEAILKS